MAVGSREGVGEGKGEKNVFRKGVSNSYKYFCFKDQRIALTGP